MRLRIGVVLVVVGMALVLAGPVLAAVVWEWRTGDTCIWLKSGVPACDANGIVIGGLFVSTAPDFEASNFPINVSHTCGSELVLAIVNEDYEDVSGGSLSDNRLIIPYFRPGYMIQLFGPSETCYVSHVQVGDPDPEPELREIIGDFSPTSLLSIHCWGPGHIYGQYNSHRGRGAVGISAVGFAYSLVAWEVRHGQSMVSQRLGV